MEINRYIIGHCLDGLRSLPDNSVDCVVTSPPYWGLRDYGDSGQLWPDVRYLPLPGMPEVVIPEQIAALGQEPDPYAFVGHLVAVFRECRRVLKTSGTLWLNIGDSYAATGRSGGGKQGAQWAEEGMDYTGPRGGKWRPAPTGLKPKDLCMIPSIVALALRTDGWYLRSDIIWAKPNPMPESVTDRPTKAHEYVLLLAKSERYFYDADAVREPHVDPREVKHGHSAMRGQASLRPMGRPGKDDGARWYHEQGRNARTVWTITPEPFPGAHFATMPPELAERCIKAGCPTGGVVLDPFMGAATVAVGAERLGRSWIGCEQNEAYAEIGRQRLLQDREQRGTLSAEDAAAVAGPMQLGLLGGV